MPTATSAARAYAAAGRGLAKRCVHLALALIVGAAFAGGASATAAVKLHVSFDPNVAGRETTLQLGLRLGGPSPVTPLPVTRLALRMPANMGLGRTTLGARNCYPALLLVGGLGACSVDSRIGFGNATAVVPVGSQALQEKVSLNALMGPPVEDHIEVLFYLQGETPVLDRLVLPSVVAPDTPPFGEQLDTLVPPVQAWPGGPELSLETFNSTIGPLGLTYRHQVGGRTVTYHPRGVRIPSVCTHGGYPFAAIVTFQGGSQTTATYTVPCPPNRKAHQRD
jgi:hypothetical protein